MIAARSLAGMALLAAVPLLQSCGRRSMESCTTISSLSHKTGLSLRVADTLSLESGVTVTVDSPVFRIVRRDSCGENFVELAARRAVVSARHSVLRQTDATCVAADSLSDHAASSSSAVRRDSRPWWRSVLLAVLAVTVAVSLLSCRGTDFRR